MKTIWTILITVLVTGGFVGGGTYYFANAKGTNDKNKLQAQIDDLNKKLSSANSIAASTDEVTDSSNSTSWKNYSNTKYGFTLTLNDLWENYIAVEIPSTSYQTAFIRFYMPTTDSAIKADSTLGGKYQNIFNIVIYTPSQWATVQAAADADTKDLKANSLLINQNADYVFAYTTPTVTALDLKDKNFDIKTVASSFKFATITTADWKTYTNDSYSLTFKYPIEWTLDNSPIEIDTGSALSVSYSTTEPLFKVSVFSTVKSLPKLEEPSGNSNATSLADYFASQKLTSSAIKLGSYNGYDVNHPDIGGAKYYYIENSGKVYVFRVVDSIKSSADNIFSTLQLQS